MYLFNYLEAEYILILGASSDIAKEAYELFLKNKSLKKIFLLSRNNESMNNELSVCIHLQDYSEVEIKKALNKVKQYTERIDLSMNFLGYLESKDYHPEKKIQDITTEHLETSLEVNTYSSIFLAKYLKPLIDKNKISAFIAISAKVGSIEDNKLGGWYSYRISKAALNMFIKTYSLEHKRNKTPCLVLAIHPGTTRTKFSKNYLKNTPYQVHSPHGTAKNILKLIQNISLDKNGSFLSWDQKEIPW
jgi:short-subunit dehydrogenase